MKYRGIPAPSPAMIVALVALVVALGGTSYAAFSLPKSSVGTTQLKNGAVTGAKLHSGAVTASKVKAHSLKAVDFAAGQLQTGSPGPATGPAGGDLTGSYPNPSIAPGAVTNRKLANPSLTITPGTGLTGGGSIALGGSGTLSADQTVVQHRVSGTCSSGSAISSINQDGTVGCQSTNVSALGNNAGLFPAVPLTNEASATITAPASGKVFVDGGYIADTTSSSCNPCRAFLVIQADGTTNADLQTTSVGNGTTSLEDSNVSQRWIFNVTAGTHTYRLQVGTFPLGAAVNFYNPTIAAVYLPG